MENWIKRILLTLTFLASVGTALAAEDEQEQVIVPEIERRVIEATGIDTENFEFGIFGGLMSVEDFGVNPVYGIRVGFHLTEDFFFESYYGMTTTDKTSYETLSGNVQLLTEEQRDYSYYNFSIGYNVLPGEAFVGRKYAFSSNLYLITGIGSTEFAGDSRFTVNFGAGYRWLASDWFAARIDVRDHMFDIDILGKDKTAQNLEFSGGLTIFF